MWILELKGLTLAISFPEPGCDTFGQLKGNEGSGNETAAHEVMKIKRWKRASKNIFRAGGNYLYVFFLQVLNWFLDVSLCHRRVAYIMVYSAHACVRGSNMGSQNGAPIDEIWILLELCQNFQIIERKSQGTFWSFSLSYYPKASHNSVNVALQKHCCRETENVVFFLSWSLCFRTKCLPGCVPRKQFWLKFKVFVDINTIDVNGTDIEKENYSKRLGSSAVWPSWKNGGRFLTLFEET